MLEFVGLVWLLRLRGNVFGSFHRFAPAFTANFTRTCSHTNRSSNRICISVFTMLAQDSRTVEICRQAALGGLSAHGTCTAIVLD
jgi:hypothetical protein